MTKRISKILLLLFLTILILIPSSYGYENDIFTFDLPEGYGALEYKEENQGMYVFVDKDENSERGLIIYVKDDNALKKSVWDIDDTDLDRIVKSMSIGGVNVSKDKKAKLGKEKAIRLVLQDNGEYIEMYILASNKHVYMVVFSGKSQEELNNEEYKIIKNSFKLKDRTTNPTVIYILVIGIIVAIVFYTKYIKQRKYTNKAYNLNNFDYKNMTEDDFNNLDK